MVNGSKIFFGRFGVYYFLLLLLGVLVFLASYLIAPYHHSGDQMHYTEAFNSIKNLNLLDAFDVYRSIIFTAEPIHFFITWIFSSLGVEKNILMSLANVVMVFFLFKLLHANKFPLWLSLLILFNSYILAMMFTLERNKFSFIFMMGALIYRKKYLWILSIFSHSVAIIPVLAFVIDGYITSIKTKGLIFLGYGWVRVCLMASFVLIVIYYGLFQNIEEKFLQYSEMNAEEEGYGILLLILFSGFSIFFSENKQRSIIYNLTLVIIYFFIGATRLNMLAYFGFLYFSNAKNSLFQAVVAVLSIYLLYKSSVYLNMIITAGG